MSAIFYMYAALALFAFNLFPAGWKTWLIAFLLLLPVWYMFFTLAMDGNSGNWHPNGWGWKFFGFLMLPMIGGNLIRAASLSAQSCGWSRQKALVIDGAGALILIGIHLSLRAAWFGETA